MCGILGVVSARKETSCPDVFDRALDVMTHAGPTIAAPGAFHSTASARPWPTQPSERLGHDAQRPLRGGAGPAGTLGAGARNGRPPAPPALFRPPSPLHPRPVARAATSPMSRWTDASTITFNGEIFNFHEIRDRLKALGHLHERVGHRGHPVAWRQVGPSEVASVERHVCVRVWDAQTRELHRRARPRRRQAALLGPRVRSVSRSPPRSRRCWRCRACRAH